LDVDVDVSDAHNFYVGRTRDISVGGLFIESPIGIAVGTEVGVKLRIGGEPFVLNCRVAWRHLDDDGSSAGFGVEFMRLPLQTRRSIQAYMRKRAPEIIDLGGEICDADPLSEALPDEEPTPMSVARPGPPPLPCRVPRPAPRSAAG
jgi:Tfp pilus assembly protein PilZ